MSIRWIVAILSLIASWSLGGATIYLLSNNEMIDRLSGLIGLIIGIIALLLILSKNDEAEDNIERIEKEITKKELELSDLKKRKAELEAQLQE